MLAAATVFIEREWAVVVSMLAGLLMAGYIVVEAFIMDSKVGNVLPNVLELQFLFGVPALAVFGLAGYLWMREYGSQHFHLGHASHA